MKLKYIALIIGIYLVIFGFIFYLLLPTETEETIDDVTATESLKYFFSNFVSNFSFRNFINPFGFFSNFKFSSIFIIESCDFSRGIDCLYFSYDKEEKFIIFELENQLNRNIHLMDIEIFGDVICRERYNLSISNRDSLFVRLDDCEFKGHEGLIILRYHEGSPTFYRMVEGSIKVK